MSSRTREMRFVQDEHAASSVKEYVSFEAIHQGLVRAAPLAAVTLATVISRRATPSMMIAQTAMSISHLTNPSTWPPADVRKSHVSGSVRRSELHAKQTHCRVVSSNEVLLALFRPAKLVRVSTTEEDVEKNWDALRERETTIPSQPLDGTNLLDRFLKLLHPWSVVWRRAVKSARG